VGAGSPADVVAAAGVAAGAVVAVLFLRPRRASPDSAGPPLPAEAA
jgi:membrane-associated phospholipid phosphatase